MWKSRNKMELMIEVWEKLDCETVGAKEIEAIETVVLDVFGRAAVESPMRIARLLADEGAELRHSEIMELYIQRASNRPYDAVFENLLDMSSLGAALRSIRQMENLRKKFQADGDREGARLLKQSAIAEKETKLAIAKKETIAQSVRDESGEIAEWLRLWLQSPELFEPWIELRRTSPAFRAAFGDLKTK